MQWLRRLSIKSKLIVMLLTVSSCSILVTAYLGYRSGQSNLTSRVFSQLTSLRSSKAYQIESYFKTVRNHIQTLSEDPTIVTATNEFTSTYRQLETVQVPAEFNQKLTAYCRDEFSPKLAKTEPGSPLLNSFLPESPASFYLQYHYIAANPNPIGKKDVSNAATDKSKYIGIHARYHPIFRNIIKKFGYYDMFLIDPQGRVVYTVYKETDFTTNLTTGAYSESNLARLVAQIRQANKTDYARIIDFEGYTPSYGALATFIAAPIFDRAKFGNVLDLWI